MVASISAIKAELPGGQFTLLADLTAFNELEQRFNLPWFDLLDKVRGQMRMADVAELFAAFARSGGHEGLTATDALNAFGDMPGYAKAIRYVQDAINAAMPSKAETGDGKGEAHGTPPQ